MNHRLATLKGTLAITKSCRLHRGNAKQTDAHDENRDQDLDEPHSRTVGTAFVNGARTGSASASARTGYQAHGHAPPPLARSVEILLPEAMLTTRTFSAGWVVGMQNRKAVSSSAPLGAEAARPRPVEKNTTSVPPLSCTARLIVATRMDSPASTLPLLLASTKATNEFALPSQPAHTFILVLRRTASIRAVCKVATISFAELVKRLLLMSDVKLGVAMASKIAATAMVTISSIKVKPLERPALDLWMAALPRLSTSCIVSPGHMLDSHPIVRVATLPSLDDGRHFYVHERQGGAPPALYRHDAIHLLLLARLLDAS